MVSDAKNICDLDENMLIAVLQSLDNDKTRASMACVSKTWRSCVQKSWNRIHFWFDSESTLSTQLTWLARQLQDCPQLLQSLELYSSMPTPVPCKPGDRPICCCYLPVYYCPYSPIWLNISVFL